MDRSPADMTETFPPRREHFTRVAGGVINGDTVAVNPPPLSRRCQVSGACCSCHTVEITTSPSLPGSAGHRAFSMSSVKLADEIRCNGSCPTANSLAIPQIDHLAVGPINYRPVVGASFSRMCDRGRRSCTTRMSERTS